MALGYEAGGWEYRLGEHHIYGSSRIGVHQTNLLLRSRFDEGDILVTLEDVDYTSLYRGKRHYELSNHLGNVQVVVSDKRISVCDEELEVEYFKADVLAAMDYYPFGMMMPDRQWYANSDSSIAVNGFNGMRKDNEINGVGNSLDFGARIYDARLGRFLSVDFNYRLMPFWSSYSISYNNPIRLIDFNGLNPGDPFDSEEEAVKDFAKIYNVKSIRKGKEYAAIIYSYVDENGNTKYSYTKPNKGTASSSNSGKLKDNTKKAIGVIHTHGNYLQDSDNEFSPDDKDEYTINNIRNAYVVTPSGTILRWRGYNSNSEEIIEVVSRDAPSDPADPNHNNNVVEIRAIDKISRWIARTKFQMAMGSTSSEVRVDQKSESYTNGQKNENYQQSYQFSKTTETKSSVEEGSDRKQ